LSVLKRELAILSPPIWSDPTPRPTRPPLFPYTTLFRSGGAQRDREPVHLPRQRHRGDRPTAAVEDLQRSGRHRDGPPRTSTMTLDRKSTRLNSSHVKISYAVFCLKKKTD